MIPPFRAFLVEEDRPTFKAGIVELTEDHLPPGEVLIKVAYSGINFKDAMACNPGGRIIRKFPCVPGIDLSGTVVESSDARFKPGDPVVAQSFDIGVSRHGGFGEYARVPAKWVMTLPEGLTLREAMIYGTAGFTAALSIHRIETHNKGQVLPDWQGGPVLVTGATGGVGSFSISMLHTHGYQVVASTGKAQEHEYLKTLGAAEIMSREDVAAETPKALEGERWVGSVDSVGGTTLAYLTRTTRTGFPIASCGLTGGANIALTVYPFILRGISLLGVDSVNCPMELRQDLWNRMGQTADFKPADMDSLVAEEVTLDQVPDATQRILAGKVRGRILVRL